MTIAFVSMLALVLLGGGGLIAFLNFRRRQRIWFAGDSANPIVRLAERRALLIRELRDIDFALQSGRVTAEIADSRRDTLMQEVVALSSQLDALREARSKLENQIAIDRPAGGGGAAMLFGACVLAAIATAGQATAQQSIQWPDPESLPNNGVIEVRMHNPSGVIESFADALVAVAVLPNHHMPFDEFTQMEWQQSFDQIVDPHRMPSETELALGQVKQVLKGSLFESNVSGTLRLDGWPAFTRLVVAVQHGGIWWPCRQEFWFDERFQEKTAIVEIHALSTDTRSLEIDEWHVEASVKPTTVSDLRWLEVDMLETIRITNPSETHAVIGNAALSGGEWLVFPLTPPPGVGPEELAGGVISSSWAYFVGRPALDPIPFHGTGHIEPYVPWSRGLEWTDAASSSGDPHSGMQGHNPHGAQRARSLWPIPGAKSSEDNTHPLNQDGMHEFIGAGSVYLRFIETDVISALCLVVNKPIPPRSTMVIRLLQAPGFSYDDPRTIAVFRPSLGIPVRQFRALTVNLLEMSSRSGFLLSAVQRDGFQPGQGTILWDATPDPDGFAIDRNTSISFGIAPGGELKRRISVTAERQRDEERKTPAKPIAPLGAVGESGNQMLSSMLWTGSVLLVITAIVLLLVMTRGTTEQQLQALSRPVFTREQGIIELAELESDYRKGQIPATVYREERARILNRLAAMGE